MDHVLLATDVTASHLRGTPDDKAHPMTRHTR